MKSRLSVATVVLAAALALPAAAFAQGGFKEAVKDSVITAKIKTAMAKDKDVSATSIKVETDASGMVQLSGTAKSSAEASKAESIAKGVEGVTSVDNKIVVSQK